MANLGNEFFSGVSYQVVGIVLALIVFDAFKEGIFLPIFDGIYHAKDMDRPTQIEYEESGALVVVRGPFRFRIGYLVSRLLFFAALLLVALPCMWRWKRSGDRPRTRPEAYSGDSASSDAVDIDTTLAEVETPTAVAAEGKIAAKAAVAGHHLL